MNSQNQESSFLKRVFRWIPHFFYPAAAVWVVYALLKPVPAPDLRLVQALLADDASVFPAWGQSFEPLRRELAEGDRFFFLMDYPFHPYGSTVEQLYTAQSILVPVLLNPQPGDAKAIVWCSSPEAAEQRLAETGYKWLKNSGNGKGLAVKST